MKNKNIDVVGLQQRNAVVRNITPEQIENRQVEFVISTESVDSYGTCFRLEGWDLERYQNNPIVFYAHGSWSSDPDMIIGTSEVFVEGEALIGRMTFESGETNPLAEKVFRKVQNGMLRMASIGADVKEAHWGIFENGENPEVLYFDRQELLEWSVVPIGSNPDALKRSTEVLEDVKKRFPKPTSNTQHPTSNLKLRERQLKLYNLKSK